MAIFDSKGRGKSDKLPPSTMASNDIDSDDFAIPVASDPVPAVIEQPIEIVSKDNQVVVQDLGKHLNALARRVQSARKMIAKNIIGIGESLSEARDLLAQPDSKGHGSFSKWVKLKCGFSRATAYRYIAAFDTFGTSIGQVHQFDASALYRLSADKAPPAAVAQAIELAEAGEKVTAEIAKALVVEHSPKKTTRKVPKPIMIETADAVIIIRPKRTGVDVEGLLRNVLLHKQDWLPKKAA